MVRNRASAAVSLILVFSSGILLGAGAHRLYMTNTASASTQPRNMVEYRRRYLSEMRAKVGVNEAQISAVVKILDDTKRQFDDLNAKQKPLRDKIQQDHVEAIRALLSDDQKIAFDKWRTERELSKRQAKAESH